MSRPLSEFDIILMRKDPPFDMEYIYTTYALELAEKDGVLVANKPQSLRDANEKFFTLIFHTVVQLPWLREISNACELFGGTINKLFLNPLKVWVAVRYFHVDRAWA